MADENLPPDSDRIKRLEDQLRRVEEFARQTSGQLKALRAERNARHGQTAFWLLTVSATLGLVTVCMLALGIDHLRQKRSFDGLLRSEFVPVYSPDGVIPGDAADHLVSLRALPPETSAVFCSFRVSPPAVAQGSKDHPVTYTVSSRVRDREFRYPVFTGTSSQVAENGPTACVWLPYPSDGNLHVRSSGLGTAAAGGSCWVKILGYR